MQPSLSGAKREVIPLSVACPASSPNSLLWTGLCPLRIPVLKTEPPAPRNVTVFGDEAFKELLKQKQEHLVWPEPNWTDVL